MKKSKILVLSSLSLAAVLALVSCGEGDKNSVTSKTSGVFAEETIEYNNNVSKSTLFNKSNQLQASTSILLSGDVTDETPKAKVDALLEAGFTTEGLGKISGYNSTYKKVTVGQSVDDISAWGTDNSLVYPGSIVRIQDPTKGNSAITSYGVRSGNIDLSTSMYTSTGKTDGAVKKNIKNATLSNVREAIGDLVDKNLVDGSTHACQISSSVQEIKNENELSVVLGTSSASTSNSQISAMINQSANVFGFNEKLGATGNMLSSGNAKVVENNNTSSGSSHYYACIQLTQVYYSMDIDLVYDASDIITDDLTEDRVNYLRSLGGIPGVVSSVQYGRKAVCVLELDCSYSQYINELNSKSTVYDNKEFGALVDMSYKDYVDAEAGASGSGDNQTSNNGTENGNNSSSNHVMNSTCFIYGGDNESSLQAVQSTTASEIVKAFTSSVDPKKMVGCPISYTIRSIDGQNSLIKVGTSDTYYERELTPIVPTGDITLSEADIDEIDGINLGTSIEVAANRQPVDATLFPIEYSLEFDDRSIAAEKTTNGVIYKKDDTKLASISKKNDKSTITLENEAYLAGQKVTLVAKYTDSKYEEYTYTKRFTIKPYALTVKNSNGEVVDTVVATNDNGKYVVDLSTLKVNGKTYNRFFDEKHNVISDVVELKANKTVVLPKDVSVTVSGYGLSNEGTIDLQEGDSVTYAELRALVSFDSSKYEFARLEINGKTIASGATINVTDDITVKAVINDIESYTLTIKDASGNVVGTYKTLKQNERCYVDLPELTFNGTTYNRIFDENHNVVKNDTVELTSDVVYTLPRISVYTLTGTGLSKDITVYVQEGDTVSYSELVNLVADKYDTKKFELDGLYDQNNNLVHSSYNFDTTKDVTITVKFNDIEAYTLTIKNASGNVVTTISTVKENGKCYADLGTLTFDGKTYNRIFDENHNVVAGTKVELSENKVYTLPRISTYTLTGSGLTSVKTFEVQEGDSNASIMTSLNAALEYDSVLYKFLNFSDVYGNVVNSGYAFDTTNNCVINAIFENLNQGSKTFTYDDFKNVNVSYDLAKYKKEEYFPELNKYQLLLSDFLTDLNITVDYNTNTVTVNSIKGNGHSWSNYQSSTYYSEYLTPLAVVKDSSSNVSEAYNYESYTNHTSYGTGWTYLLLDSSSLTISKDGSLKVSNLADVKLIISVAEESGVSEAGDDYWVDYYQLVISLDLRK